MKKEYIKPFSKTYFVSPIHMVAESFPTDEGKEDIDVGDARENNSDNSNSGGNSIWDNAW